jgi:mono/diheme cytochrome c family protein
MARNPIAPAALMLVIVFAIVLLCRIDVPAHAAMPAPVTATPSAGQTLFHEKGCEHCHGVNGLGTDKGPDLRGVGRRLKREQIEHQIHDGGDSMPAFADVLDETELKALTDSLAARREKVKRAAKTSPSPRSE